MEYSHLVGERLRKVRAQNKFSLKDVEKMTNGFIKASILGAYERGERVISVPRLFELADFFKVPVNYLLKDGDKEAMHEVNVATHPASSEAVRINLVNLSKTRNRDAQSIKSYIDSIKKKREDFNVEVITIREDDLQMLAAMFHTTTEGVNDKLEKLNLIVN